MPQTLQLGWLKVSIVTRPWSGLAASAQTRAHLQKSAKNNEHFDESEPAKPSLEGSSIMPNRLARSVPKILDL